MGLRRVGQPHTAPTPVNTVPAHGSDLTCGFPINLAGWTLLAGDEMSIVVSDVVSQDEHNARLKCWTVEHE